MNETASDVQKPEPKVTVEQALKAVGPKIESVLKEALAGFELADDDKKSRKSIVRAVGNAVGATLGGQAGLNRYNLQRNLGYGLATGCPAPPTPAYSDFETEDDDSDDDGDED
jgi:hypothetical protein